VRRELNVCSAERAFAPRCRAVEPRRFRSAGFPFETRQERFAGSSVPSSFRGLGIYGAGARKVELGTWLFGRRYNRAHGAVAFLLFPLPKPSVKPNSVSRWSRAPFNLRREDPRQSQHGVWRSRHSQAELRPLCRATG